MGRPARSGTGNSLAKRLGVSRQRVSALKKKGRVKMVGSKVDENASERMHRERLAAQQTSPSRQLKDLYAAKRSKLEYDKMIGSVVEKAQVEKEAFRIARIIRDTLLRLPDRLAGILASESDQNKIHALLTKELRQVLEGLSMTATTEPTS